MTKNTSLITVLKNFLKLESEIQLIEKLNHPDVISKVNEFLLKKRIRTNYKNKANEYKSLANAKIGTKSADWQYAYQGFLNITVRQHFYVKFRIRLRYPKIRCISEEVKTGVFHFYPLELLVVEEDENLEKKDDTKDEVNDEDICVNWTATCTYCTCKK